MAIRRIEGFPYDGYNAEKNLEYIELSILKIILLSGLLPENFEKYSIDDLIEAIEETFPYNKETAQIKSAEGNLPVYVFLRKHRFFLKDTCKKLWFWRQLAKFEVKNV